MESKISNFIIAIIVISFTVLAMGVYYAGVASSYNVVDNANFTGYNQLKNITATTTALQTSVTAPFSSNLGGFNILGDFLSAGVSVLQTMLTSFSMFNIMLATAFSPGNIPIADVANVIGAIEIGLGAIVIVILSFIIIGAITGRQGL